jgi:hypothetical protein
MMGQEAAPPDADRFGSLRAGDGPSRCKEIARADFIPKRFAGTMRGSGLVGTGGVGGGVRGVVAGKRAWSRSVGGCRRSKGGA